MTDIHTRTQFLVNTLGPNPSAFANKINMYRHSVYSVIGYKSRKSVPSFQFVCKVLHTFPQINPRWYLLGEGVWNINNQKLSRKESNKFSEELKRIREEADNYKKLYAEEKFVNDALREKIRKSIR